MTGVGAHATSPTTAPPTFLASERIRSATAPAALIELLRSSLEGMGPSGSSPYPSISARGKRLLELPFDVREIGWICNGEAHIVTGHDFSPTVQSCPGLTDPIAVRFKIQREMELTAKKLASQLCGFVQTVWRLRGGEAAAAGPADLRPEPADPETGLPSAISKSARLYRKVRSGSCHRAPQRWRVPRRGRAHFRRSPKSPNGCPV